MIVVSTSCWNIFLDFGPLLFPFHREVHHPHLFSFLTGTVVTLAFAEPWMRCLDFDKCATPFRSLGSNQADVYQFPMSSTSQFLRQPLFLDMHKHFCEPQLSRTASKPTLASVFPFWCVLCTICLFLWRVVLVRISARSPLIQDRFVARVDAYSCNYACCFAIFVVNAELNSTSVFGLCLAALDAIWEQKNVFRTRHPFAPQQFAVKSAIRSMSISNVGDYKQNGNACV